MGYTLSMWTVRLIGRQDGRDFLDRNTYKFTLGEGSEVGIVEGVEQGLRSMKTGERALLRIKAKYAYAAAGCERLGVLPDADVVFDVELESYDPVLRLFIHLFINFLRLLLARFGIVLECAVISYIVFLVFFFLLISVLPL